MSDFSEPRYCITCGLCETTRYQKPKCVLTKKYVWVSGHCNHWQRERPNGVLP